MELPEVFLKGINGHHFEVGGFPFADARGNIHLMARMSAGDLVSIAAPVPLIQAIVMAPMPTAPVVCWVIEIMDNPRQVLRIGTCFDVLEPLQHGLLVRLDLQRSILLHFVAADCFGILATKPLPPPEGAACALRGALAHCRGIPAERYDFHAAKTVFLRDYSTGDVLGGGLF